MSEVVEDGRWWPSCGGRSCLLAAVRYTNDDVALVVLIRSKCPKVVEVDVALGRSAAMYVLAR